MNTRIEYVYIDGSNYKFWRTVVVAGEVSFEDIAATLFDGRYFVASIVGLPDPRSDVDGYNPDGDDHYLCRLTSSSFQSTTDDANVKIDVKELIQRFVNEGGGDGRGWFNRSMEELGLIRFADPSQCQ